MHTITDVPTQDPTDGLRFLLVGAPSVYHQGAPVVCTGRRQTLLLCLLALSVQSPVETGRLFEALWPGSLPHDPGNALQSQVSRLRRPPVAAQIRQVGGGYLLDESPDAVDTHRFERLVSRSRRVLSAGAYALARTQAAQALQLWRGEPMAALQDDLEIRRSAVRLGELRLEAYTVQAEAEIALGLHAETVPGLRSMVQQHPLREDLWAMLVTALYRSGRSADALSAMRAARGMLVRELGLDPGPRLRELESAVLGHQASLVSPPHPCAAHATVLLGPGPASFLLEIPPPVGSFGASADWADYPATRLFLSRLRASHPNAEPDARQAAQIVTVCRLLDGDPLAIELAAASLAPTGLSGLGALLDRHRKHRMSRNAAVGSLPNPAGVGSSPAGRLASGASEVAGDDHPVAVAGGRG